MTRTAAPPRLQRRTHSLLRGLGLLHPRAQAAAASHPALQAAAAVANSCQRASPLSALPPTCATQRRAAHSLTRPRPNFACLPAFWLAFSARCWPACRVVPRALLPVRQISPPVCFCCCVVALGSPRACVGCRATSWWCPREMPALSSAPPAASQYRRRCRPLSPRPRPRLRALPTSLPSSHPSSLTLPHLSSPPLCLPPPAVQPPPNLRPLPLRTPPPLCEHRRM